MAYYFGIIDGQDGVYGVRVPDLPGAYGAGDTQEEAVHSAIAAMTEWAKISQEDSAPIPAPRSISDLMRDKDVADTIAEGEAFVALPLLIEEKRSVRANISLDAGTLAAIDAAAKRAGLTRSAFLASAARDKILSSV
ncbi:MAG: type II toxin-antitoxin system HicB family antitoxin [Ancalomicrobiaceae bacterium]|nr:type II toxin-antitoxin system HicB family antitoxin [Ancalomicrobiaceae bacterium]